MYRYGYIPFASLPNTFAITGGTGLNLGCLAYLLSKRCGWTPIDTSRKCDYVYFNYLEKLTHDLRHFDSNLIATKCQYKNILPPTKMCIADKGCLYENVAAIGKGKCMAESWIDGMDVPEDAMNSVLIIRPIGDFADSGHGISITHTSQGYRASIEKMKSLIASSNGKLKRFIVSRYIINPKTYGGKKYHLRSYFVYRTDRHGNRRWDVFDRSRVVTAKNDYIPGEWSNKDIHDTHSASTDRNIFVDTPDVPDIQHIADILGEIMVRNNVLPYDESKVGYEVFGLDILPTESGYTLLEANSRVGMKDLGDGPSVKYEDSFEKFSSDYFEWLLKIVF